MVNNINDRTEEMIRMLGMNPNSFAEYIEVAPTVIYNIIGSRKSKPSFELIEKITSKVENLNINWYIKGVGDPFGSEGARKVYIEDKITEMNKEVEGHRLLLKAVCDFVLNAPISNKGDEKRKQADLIFQKFLSTNPDMSRYGGGEIKKKV